MNNKLTPEAYAYASSFHPAIYEMFRKFGNLREYKRDSFVYLQDAPLNAGFLIEKGLLKVCGFSLKGQDITLFLRKKGDYFGLAEIILGRESLSNAQCLQDCMIWVLDASIVQEQIRTNMDVNTEILYTMTNRLIQQQRTVELLIAKPVSWRMAWLLKQFSSETEAGNHVVDIILTHEEISRIVGCSRQTVSETMNKWRKLGFISYNRKSIVLDDLSKLLEYTQ